MSKIYLNNRDLLNEINKSKESNKLTLAAQEMFVLLVKRVSGKFRYFNPADKDDCMQTALLDLFSNWKNFDPSKSTNAFAYYTEICKRGLARGHNSLYKKKGDPENYHKHVSIDRANDGEGIFSL